MSFLLFALAATTNPASIRDWGSALRTDATAMHEAIAASHPGPVNPNDPKFAARNDAQWNRAMSRAASARTFEDYFYAMQEYAASFDDGHLSYGVWGATPDDVRRWPGFLTRYDAAGRQSVFVSEPWSGVPLNARLLSCDGLSADQVARRRIGSRLGRWNFISQRLMFGTMAFLDTGNPYVGSVKRCRFSSHGRTIDVRVRWRPPERDLSELIIPRRERSSVNSRRLPDGTRWLSLPSFDGDPDGETGKALRALIGQLDANAGEFRSAPAIVLDLRGNGGGSSDWSLQIARSLWGQAAIDSHPEPPMTVSWRASTDNLEAIRKSYSERSAGGHLSPEVDAWYKETMAGLGKAISERKPLWVIKPEKVEQERPMWRQPPDLATPVFVLTDGACMSACLDAVDLWTRLGAIRIGQETAADTLYMEVRQVALPAGLGALSLPMKVYSGRERGDNVPVVPKHRFNGDIGDTSALERWIATLPERRTVRPAE